MGSNGVVTYFTAQSLEVGTHRLDITVTTANATNQFILDYFLVNLAPGGPSSIVSTSSNVPSSTSTSSSPPVAATRATPVGAIVGGVVGGIAILAIALWYLLRRRSGRSRAHYSERPRRTDIFAGEGLYTPHRLCRRMSRAYASSSRSC
jgi:Na+/H+-translocating membrane pyrophosphatase